MSQPSEPRPPISVARILKVVLPVAVVAIVAYWWSMRLEPSARAKMASNVFARMLSADAAMSDTSMSYPDKDGDLVADSPEDPAQCINPDVLVFSSVAEAAATTNEDTWKELLSALSDKTSRQVKYVQFSKVDEQLAALKNGELHIAVLNTGTVPAAVQRDGFVPLCTFGQPDGTFGYTMQFLVPADSAIKEPKDIRSHKVTFTRPDSNSGFKAPVVYLKDQHDMLPERDYSWGFSLGHEESIKGVAAKEIEVAPVASDILDRMIEKGDVDPQAIRSIYVSERFPPATIGYAYNLTPELRGAIRAALVDFDLTGTGLQGEFGTNVTKLVQVNYKDDWANARRIDRVIAEARAGR
jgi:phosphonate transport system substrate-binding protein